MQLWLEADCYRLLLNRIQPDSAARCALEGAAKVYNHGLVPDAFCVICSSQDTQKFLATAIRHFPDHVGEIVLAIITAKE